MAFSFKQDNEHLNFDLSLTNPKAFAKGLFSLPLSFLWTAPYSFLPSLAS